MATSTDNDIPQWKKDLIARLRNQNKCSTKAANASKQQQLSASAAGPPHHSSVAVGRMGQQPNQTWNFSKSVSAAEPVGAVNGKCNIKCTTCSASSIMVQERVWLDSRQDELKMVSETYECEEYSKNSESDSSEDLHYGPGIVNKLKNKYLSLALRESSTRPRPTILHMRKAASLENMLDDDEDEDEAEDVNNVVSAVTTAGRSRLYRSKLNGNDTGRNVPNRYRNASRGTEMKRARSVETISRRDNISSLTSDTESNRKSLHEDMLLDREGNDWSHITDKIPEPPLDKPCNKKVPVPPRTNKPKRIPPMMNEREKPPADVVKQAKLIFEKRAEQRTRAPHVTGDVAAKVATYRDIIVKAKAANKPPLKAKPTGIAVEKPKIIPRSKTVNANTENMPSQTEIRNNMINIPNKTSTAEGSLLPSPIPDVSRVEIIRAENESKGKTNSSLSETPDLILISSPHGSDVYNKNITERFLKEEITFSMATRYTETSDVQDSAVTKPAVIELIECNNLQSKIGDDANKKTSPLEPLSLEINGFDNFEIQRSSSMIVQQSENYGTESPPRVLSPVVTSSKHSSPVVLSPRITSPVLLGTNCVPKMNPSDVNRDVISPIPHLSDRENKKDPPTPHLTNTEIEKNLINKFKTLEQTNSSVSDTSAEEIKKILVPKPRRTPPSAHESNCMEYNFTNRKGTPNYIKNDKSRTVTARVDVPKTGDGGIILLPGASIGESFTDEDDEVMRSLEAPPSPCDVTFINDNILIDGKSSLSQKTKKARMKISFVDGGPDVYEYPSENSLLIEESPPSPVSQSLGHAVPMLSGSTLANYTPKSTEDFLPGVTRPTVYFKEESSSSNSTAQLTSDDIEKPILFSAGTNSDILF